MYLRLTRYRIAVDRFAVAKDSVEWERPELLDPIFGEGEHPASSFAVLKLFPGSNHLDLGKVISLLKYVAHINNVLFLR